MDKSPDYLRPRFLHHRMDIQLGTLISPNAHRGAVDAKAHQETMLTWIDVSRGQFPI